MAYLKVSKKFLFWYIKLVSNNGEVLMHSETYYSRYNATRAAKRISERLGVKYE